MKAENDKKNFFCCKQVYSVAIRIREITINLFLFLFERQERFCSSHFFILTIDYFLSRIIFLLFIYKWLKYIFLNSSYCLNKICMEFPGKLILANKIEYQNWFTHFKSTCENKKTKIGTQEHKLVKVCEMMLYLFIYLHLKWIHFVILK